MPGQPTQATGARHRTCALRAAAGACAAHIAGHNPPRGWPLACRRAGIPTPVPPRSLQTNGTGTHGACVWACSPGLLAGLVASASFGPAGPSRSRLGSARLGSMRQASTDPPCATAAEPHRHRHQPSLRLSSARPTTFLTGARSPAAFGPRGRAGGARDRVLQLRCDTEQAPRGPSQLPAAGRRRRVAAGGAAAAVTNPRPRPIPRHAATRRAATAERAMFVQPRRLAPGLTRSPSPSTRGRPVSASTARPDVIAVHPRPPMPPSCCPPPAACPRRTCGRTGGRTPMSRQRRQRGWPKAAGLPR